MDAVVRAVTLLDRIDACLAQARDTKLTDFAKAEAALMLLSDCRAEIARLRRALTEIAREDGIRRPPGDAWADGWVTGMDNQARIARAALRGE